MDAVDNITSRKISNASVFATMMVVGIHTLGHGWQLLDKGSAIWWLTAFGQYGLFSIAVPFFFICSGYFLAGHMDITGWLCIELKKRIITLVIPYICWSIIFLLLTICLGVVAGNDLSQCVSISFWVEGFGLNILRHPKLGPLWFVRSLMMFVVVSPVVLLLLRNRKLGVFALMFIYFLAGIVHFVGGFSKPIELFFTYGFNLFGFLYFCLGIYGRIWHVKLPKHGHVVTLALGLSLVLAGAVINIHGLRWKIPQSGLTVPLLLFAFWGGVPSWELPKYLTQTTFAIFLLHIPVFKVLGFILPTKIESVFQWIMKWGVGWTCSLILALGIGRSFPLVAKMLFGGRV